MSEPDEYEQITSRLRDFGQRLKKLVEDLLKANSISVNQVTYRVKERKSAFDKVRDHPDKYRSIADLTDLLGVRIITYFPDQVDAVAEVITSEFDIDYSQSVDKRSTLEPDQFGYLSMHFIGTLNDNRSALAEYNPFINVKIEFQIRSLLQHAWAEIEHDLGYKSKVAVPRNIRRRFSRLAGLLEVADTEFQAILDETTKYATRVSAELNIGTSNLLIDNISLIAYIEHSPLVKELDEKLALIFHSHVEPESNASTLYAQRIVDAILPFGIEYISELDQAVNERTDIIVKFAKEWAKYGYSKNEPIPSEVPHGMSLFYFAIVFAVEMFGDEQTLDRWIDQSLELERVTADDFREAYRIADDY
jgi:ppGpp synthetase/RelA/SpoT-type nucleotidyltranferase